MRRREEQAERGIKARADENCAADAERAHFTECRREELESSMADAVRREDYASAASLKKRLVELEEGE